MALETDGAWKGAGEAEAGADDDGETNTDEEALPSLVEM